MRRTIYALLTLALITLAVAGAGALRSGEEIEAEGPVEVLDVAAGTLTVQQLTFLTTTDTIFGDEEEGDASFTLGDLAVGDAVDVEGYHRPDGTLVASEVEHQDAEDDAEDDDMDERGDD